MIVKPKIRGFICTTAHPVGCAQNIQEQIDYVKKQNPISRGPKKALIVGASTGYGLSSRIAAAFGSQAATIGVFFEKGAENKRTATAGWYNAAAFEEKARKEGLYARSFNGDAFSDEMRQDAAAAVKKDLGGIDLLVYSLAAPRRLNPRTGQVSKSVLKPITAPYAGKSIDLDAEKLEMVTLPQANPQEIEQTVSVMGGEDWEFWIEALEKEGLLLQGFTTVAYSYLGPEVTRPIYREGTIGKAKEHLEATAQKLDQRLRKVQGRALISVNKALITQSSSAIPVIPLYFAVLNKIMQEKHLDENCIEQMWRLFNARLYITGKPLVDKQGLIRLDDLEMREDVQAEAFSQWQKLNDGNLKEIANLENYHEQFLRLFGFGRSDVDYEADVEVDIKLPSAGG